MTHEEIFAAVQADPALVALVPNTQAIADALSVDRKRLIERKIGIGTVMDTLGAETGAALLKQFQGQIATDPVVEFGWFLLEKDNLDVGLPSTRAMLDSKLPAEASVKLKALAETSDPVSEFEVRCALLNNDGTWKV